MQNTEMSVRINKVFSDRHSNEDDDRKRRIPERPPKPPRIPDPDSPVIPPPKDPPDEPPKDPPDKPPKPPKKLPGGSDKEERELKHV